MGSEMCIRDRVGQLRGALGFGQGDVELRQFVGPLGDPSLQAFVGFGQRLFSLAERGDVGETHDKTATRHRVADQLDHTTIGEKSFRGVGAALTHPVQAPGHVHFGFAGTAQTAFGVVANNVGNRAAKPDQSIRVVEQLQICLLYTSPSPRDS